MSAPKDNRIPRDTNGTGSYSQDANNGRGYSRAPSPMPKLSGMKERAKREAAPVPPRPVRNVQPQRPKAQYVPARPTPKKGKGMAAALVIVVIFAAIAGAAWYAWDQHMQDQYVWDNLLQYENVIYPGVYIDGKPVGGRTIAEVEAIYAQNRQESKHDEPVTLTLGDKTYSVPIVMHTDATEQIQRAYAIGRSGSLKERLAKVTALKETPVFLTTQLVYDTEAVHKYLLETVKPAVDAPAIDASFEYDTEKAKVNVTPEKSGLSLDIAPIEQAIAGMVERGVRQPVAITMTEVPAEVTGADMKEYSTPIAEYTTNIISWRDKNRTDNIRLCLSFFNGMVVKPGKTVSFNDVVGPRTQARGFRPAPEYNAIEGVVEGVGGGACQASTTLYVALLKAGLTITKRTQHSFTVGYAEPSLDAAVYYGRFDLAFKNNTKGNIFITTKVEQKKVTVRIYGKRAGEDTIKLESIKLSVIEKPDPEIILDLEAKYVTYTDESRIVDTGKNGMKSTAYRIYLDKYGRESKRELLSADTYKPIRDKMYVGVTERWPAADTY